MKYYRSLKFCPIFNFFEAIEDVRYLLILDSYIELPEIFDLSELNKIREQLFNDYNETELCGSNQIVQLSKSILRTKNDQNIIINALYLMQFRYKGADTNLIKELEEQLTKMSYQLIYTNENELFEEIERLRKKALSKNNQIRKKEKEIHGLMTSQKSMNYLEIVLKIENHANIKLDVYKDSMQKFIYAKNEMIKIIKSKKAA